MKLAERLALAWRVLRAKPGNLMAHANSELLAAGDDEMQAMMNDGLREMVLVFSLQGHSGFSGAYAIAALEKLLRFEPLGPLTGADSEWVEVGEGMWQNRRCGRVFKGEDGRAYDIDGRVFREPDGGCFTNIDSRVYVEFPYTPTTEYVDVEAAA